MTNLNTELYDSAVDRAAMIKLYEKRISNKVSVVLDGHKVSVAKLIEEANSSDAGLKKLRRAVDIQLRKTYDATHKIARRSLLDLASNQISFTYQNIESKVGRIWNTQRPLRRVAEDIVLKDPLYKNNTLANGWQGVALSERKRIEQLIRRGVAEGKTMQAMALDVRRGRIHNISRNQAMTLVATATTSVYAQADFSVYEANADAMRGWEYVAILDSRTTSICQHRDGKIYSLKERQYLPPAHWGCRSVSIPIFKSWDALKTSEGLAHIRKRNLGKLTDKQKRYYDGAAPGRESYSDWLKRQPRDVQLRHLGSDLAVDAFSSGKIEVSSFTTPEGKSIGIRDLARLIPQKYSPDRAVRVFGTAKEKLDSLQLGASRPDDLISSSELASNLAKYYELQAGELSGVLSLVNYRGVLIGNKKAMKNRVLKAPPREDQMIFNPITKRYEDARVYQAAPEVLNNNLRLMKESGDLLERDKEFIANINMRLSGKLGVNHRAVIVDNLRIVFARARKNKDPWVNFKAVLNNQIKFDVMNVSDAIETSLRTQANPLKRLLINNYVDPVLGEVQLEDLAENLVKNIKAKNLWENRKAPKIARRLRSIFDYRIPLKLRRRLKEDDLQQFYLRFANRLALADSPDRDEFAVALGRDLYNMANFNGSRNQWYTLGLRLLEARKASEMFKLETFGVQKRRMKSKMSGAYFGPYYDTLSYNLRIVDPSVQNYAQLTRKVELGMRVGVISDKQRLLVREGFKTYFIREGPGIYYDTRIPVTSTSSFSTFPDSFITKDFADALNWAGESSYRIDGDFYDFIKNLLYFRDDKGKAQFFDDLNGYRAYLASRGDTYERFKAMEWLRNKGHAFSNHPFVDHRARVYERGLIGPQSGEAFRPFLNTAQEKILGVNGYKNLNDQIGAFLGGLSDTLEGRYNSLTVLGRQKIAEKYRGEMISIGNKMLRNKPQDIRDILTNKLVLEIDPEEQAKFFRFAIELAKIDRYLREVPSGTYDISRLNQYKTSLALEQDASSSGAQIIALTTRNKQLAGLSNVINTDQKRRLYDEIAADTFNDPRFKAINVKLGLSEKDLKKAAKAGNMVQLYGAGARTVALNVEGKLAKVLEKESDILVVKAADKNLVLDQISARAARYKKFDEETYDELIALRKDVKDVFDNGSVPGDDIMEALYFLDNNTREILDRMTRTYEKVVTPADFAKIAKIMSEHLAERVPILEQFTRYFGRLASDFLSNANPKNSAMDWKSIAKISLSGKRGRQYVLPDRVNELLGLPPKRPVSETFLKSIGLWKPNGNLADILLGVEAPKTRRTGAKYFKIELLQLKTLNEFELFFANKLPKTWTTVPWVNFEKKALEQSFTQTFQQRLTYRDKDGNWVVNMLNVPQRTEATWWEQIINKSGKIFDIADLTKARTAFAVNGNHSNDAVIVKKFHEWGRKVKIHTSTIHDAFFTNVGDMLEARRALKKIYAETLSVNVIEETLKEMLNRGFPKELYKKYREEAIKLGLIPVPGKSVVGGKLLTKEDILTIEDVLEEITDNFDNNYYWYGVG